MKEPARLAGTGLLIGLAGNLLLAPFGNSALLFTVVLSILELVLYGIGIKRISEISNENQLFTYLVFPTVVFTILFTIYLTIFGFRLSTHYIYDLGELLAQLTGFFLFLAVISIALIILEIKGYRLLAKVTNVELFNTVASLLKWGMILAVIVVGVLLIMVAHVLTIVGFFLVRDEAV